MPTIQELYKQMTEHEEMAKSASLKKTAIQSTKAPGQSGTGAAIEDVLGSNIAETKIRIKKKLEEVSGGQEVADALGAHAEEQPNQSQAPHHDDKMPPEGDKGVQAPAGLSGKLSALLNKGSEKAAKHDEKGGKHKGMPPAFLKHKKAEDEKSEEEKLAEKVAEEHFAAGQIIAQGFAYELNQLFGGEAKE